MSKLNEAAKSSSTTDVGKTKEKNFGCEEAKEEDNIAGLTYLTDEKNSKEENERRDILKFTMLFNKYNSVLETRKRNEVDKRDSNYAMFFNKEVTVRFNPDLSSTKVKMLKIRKTGSLDREQNLNCRVSRSKLRLYPQNYNGAQPEISVPEMMFYSSLTSSSPDVFEKKVQSKADNLKKFLKRRNSKVESDSFVQLNVYPATQTDLRIHNSLTSLSKNNKEGIKRDLKSKIPSLTALDTNAAHPRSGSSRFSHWDHWDDLMLVQSDADKRLNLQISRSSNDTNKRFAIKFKKEDAVSVSDSKLLYADSECKKHLKKYDKKSRGDSSRKERVSGSRKQVQWKTEVDVIYFSTHLAANGDRMAEVIGRVMEPLREEWEQQRKGFYAKMVPSHMESHVKDRFISLLKI